MIKKNSWTPDQALTELKRWCAMQERSHEAVRSKLYERGIYGDDMENIVATLISENFLNELRYAKSYVSGKFKINNWGRNKILAGLKMEKISSYNITIAMQTLDEDAYSNTLRKWRNPLKVHRLGHRRWPISAILCVQKELRLYPDMLLRMP